MERAVTVEDARDILAFTEALLFCVFPVNAKSRSFEVHLNGVAGNRSRRRPNKAMHQVALRAAGDRQGVSRTRKKQ